MRDLRAAIEAGSGSADELARALAAAGVLTARGWDWAADFDVRQASQWMAPLGSKRIWMPPSPDFEPRIGRLARPLAKAWALSFGPRPGREPTRLLLAPIGARWDPGAASDLADLSRTMLSGCLQDLRGDYVDPLDLSGPIISSIAIETGQGGQRPDHWRWPLRVAIEGLGSVFEPSHFRPEGRGLAQAVPLPDASELAFLRGLDGLKYTQAAFSTVVADAQDGLAAQLMALGQSRSIGTTALIEGGRVDLGMLATAQVYETAHDLPPDVALTLGWLNTGATTAPPIIFGDQDVFERMDAARLSNSVQELASRLGVLGERDNQPISLSQNVGYSFGMPGISEIRPLDLADALRNALRSGDVVFDRERDAASATVEVTNIVDQRFGETRRTLPSRIGDEPQPPGPTESPRYSDLVLFDEAYYPGDVTRDEARHASDAPLAAGAPYTLEVAIRAQPVSGTEDRTPVKPPRESAEPVTIYARVNALADVILEDEFLAITWPYDEDSSTVFFRFTPDTAIDGGALFEVRLLTEDLRLVDHIRLAFEEGVWKVAQLDAKASVERPTGLPASDALSLHITSSGSGYAVQAELRRGGAEPLVVPLGRTILAADIARLYADARRHWTKLTIGQMSKLEALSPPSYDKASRDLALLGRTAWRCLFGAGRGAQVGAAESLGSLLAKKPLPPDAFVRVSLADNVPDFTFPWAVLTAPGHKSDPPHAPWGLTYQIEMARRQGQTPPPRHAPVRITATIDTGFAAFVDHGRTIDDLIRTHGNATLAHADVDRDIEDALGADDPSSLYYFFCHGMAASTTPALLAEIQNEIRQAIEHLDEDAAAPWHLLVTTLGGATGGARISSTGIDLNEAALNDIEFFNGARRPLVFLNMCHSASTMPGSRTGLPALFLDRDALAVIGTEAPIPARFGDAFAKALLGRLLGGDPVGAAMLATRRDFHEKRNPLALIYTLYGRSDARLVWTDPPATPS